MILNLKEHVANNLGDFHSQVMEPASGQIARRLLRWSQLMVPYGEIQRQGALLTGAGLDPVPNLLVPLRRELVEVTGPDLQERIRVKFGDGTNDMTLIRRSSVPDFDLDNVVPGLGGGPDAPGTPEFVLFGERCEYLLWASPGAGTRAAESLLQASPSYLVPIPATLHPLSIQALRGTLLEGIDFNVGEGVLILKDHPDNLFGPVRHFVCRAARVDEPHLFDHLFSSGGTKQVDDIAQIYRGRFSAKILTRALAAVAGLEIIKVDSVLQSVTTLCSGFAYVFDTGVVLAPYAHDSLVVGETYLAGSVIGAEIIKVRRPIPGSTRWYRDDIDWSAGLSLDSFCAIQGLTAPDMPVRVEVPTGGSTGDLRHAQMWLLGTDTARTRYWAACKRAEVLTGLTLAAALGLANEGDSAMVNPIDIIFEYGGLANSALLVELNMDKLPGIARRRVVDFLRREKPSASTLIIR